MDPQARRGSDEALALLATELRALAGKLKRRLREEANPGELGSTQVSVLTRLERHGPATVTTLARAEGMRPQSMGATISALQADGLVQGEPDPSDGRQTLLSVTPACRAFIADWRAARQDWLVRTMSERLSADERTELAAALRLVRRLVD